MLFVLIIQLFFLFSCIKNSKQNPGGILLKTDFLFSDMSEIEGMHKAFPEICHGHWHRWSA